VALGVALLAAGAVGGVSAGLITGGDSPPPAAEVAATTSTPQSSITSFDQDDLSNAVARVSPTVVQVQTDAGSQGSGVILDPSGLIVTNQHVVRGATSVTILTADEHRVAADIVKADDRQDLAILRPQTPVGRGAELAEEPDGGLRLGEKVFAIGSPFGLQGTVTAGVVSTIGRTNDQGIPMIQIDAPINPGNSGGGLFDLRGRLVGIPSSILAPIPGNVGIGFAIPASRVAAMVNDIP
jgi:S1-C subfamily serine protease